MSTDYPNAIDSFTDPITSDPLNNPSHASQHTDKNDAIVAIENKVGADASTPTDGKVLKGTGAGNSSWEQVENDDMADESVDSDQYVDNSIDAEHLATNALLLGNASRTSNFSTSSSSAVQITNLTAAVTIPAGGRLVKITAFCNAMSNNNANSFAIMSIWDGVVGSGTQLASGTKKSVGANENAPVTIMALVTPSPGAKTYNIGLNVSAGGQATIEAAATAPIFILVELI